MELPDATARASKVLSFDENGLPTVEDPMVDQTQAARDQAVAAASIVTGPALWSSGYADDMGDALPDDPDPGMRFINTSDHKLYVRAADGLSWLTAVPGVGQEMFVIANTARWKFTTTYGWVNVSPSRWQSSEFNLNPDGGVDDQTDAFLAMVGAANAATNPRSREVVLRGNGVVKISSTINLDDYEKIRFVVDKNLRLVPGAARLPLFHVGYTANVSGWTDLAADAAEGAYSIQVADTSAFAVGKFLWFQSSAALPNVLNSGGGNGGTPLNRAQIARLIDKDAGNLYFDRPLTYDYLVSDDAQVGIAPMKGGWSFEGLQWGSLADTETFIGQFFSAIYVYDMRFIHPVGENSRADMTTASDNTASNFIGLDAALDVVIDDPQARMIGYYGIAYNGPCNNIEIRGGHLSACRHGFSANWTGTNGGGEPVDIRHIGTQISNCSLSGVRNHDVGRKFKYIGVRSVGSVSDRGFLFESYDQSLVDCEASNNFNDGLYVPPGAKETYVEGGRYDTNGRLGISAGEIVKVRGAAIRRNGVIGTKSGCGGVSVVGGEFAFCNIDDNKANAVVYGPNDDGVTLSPLLIHGGKITKTANQLACVYQYDKAGFDTKLLRMRDVDLTGWNPSTDYFVAKGNSSTTPAPTEYQHFGNVLSDEGTGNETRGTAVLVAGTKTVSTTKVFKYAGSTGNSGGAIAPFISKIRLQLRTAGGTPGNIRVSAVTDRTSFVITSDDAADTSTYDWWIEH